MIPFNYIVLDAFIADTGRLCLVLLLYTIPSLSGQVQKDINTHKTKLEEINTSSNYKTIITQAIEDFTRDIQTIDSHLHKSSIHVSSYSSIVGSFLSYSSKAYFIVNQKKIYPQIVAYSPAQTVRIWSRVAAGGAAFEVVGFQDNILTISSPVDPAAGPLMMPTKNLPSFDRVALSGTNTTDPAAKAQEITRTFVNNALATSGTTYSKKDKKKQRSNGGSIQCSKKEIHMLNYEHVDGNKYTAPYHDFFTEVYENLEQSEENIGKNNKQVSMPLYNIKKPLCKRVEIIWITASESKINDIKIDQDTEYYFSILLIHGKTLDSLSKKIISHLQQQNCYLINSYFIDLLYTKNNMGYLLKEFLLKNPSKLVSGVWLEYNKKPILICETAIKEYFTTGFDDNSHYNEKNMLNGISAIRQSISSYYFFDVLKFYRNYENNDITNIQNQLEYIHSSNYILLQNLYQGLVLPSTNTLQGFKQIFYLKFKSSCEKFKTLLKDIKLEIPINVNNKTINTTTPELYIGQYMTHIYNIFENTNSKIYYISPVDSVIINYPNNKSQCKPERLQTNDAALSAALATASVVLLGGGFSLDNRILQFSSSK